MAHELPQLPGVRHRFVTAGDLRTHVAIAGEGEPVLLLHGWPEHWYCWRHVIPLLSQHHQLICPDLRGFGWTDIAWKGFDKENMAGDILRLLDAMDLERVRIVGHDWGAWIGFLLALRHPERVERLVAMSGAHPFVRPTPRNLLATRRLAYQLVLAAPFLSQWLQERHPGFIHRMIKRGTRHNQGFKKRDYRDYSRALSASTRARATTYLYRTFLTREIGPVMAGRYRRRRLEVPTLIMQGEHDPVVTASFLEGVERYGDDVRSEIVDAGHFLPEEVPDLVARRTLEFFGSGERGAVQAAS